MIIRVKTEDIALTLPLPVNLIFNKGTSRIALWALENYTDVAVEGISVEKLNRLFAELRRIKHKHGHWKLVEIHTAGGEDVTVIL